MNKERNSVEAEPILRLFVLAEEKVATAALYLGRIHGLNVGLSIEDADDCAMDLVLRLLNHMKTHAPARTGEREKPLSAGPSDSRSASLLKENDDTEEQQVQGIIISEAAYARLQNIELRRWINLCARNQALNYRRSLATRRRHQSLQDTTFQELALQSEPPEERQGSTAPTGSGDQHTPEAHLIRLEFWERLFQAVQGLKPEPRRHFLQHYIIGDSIQDIAISSGKSREAVEQTLIRARKRLQHLLALQGLAEDETQEYLSLLGHLAAAAMPDVILTRTMADMDVSSPKGR